MARVISFPLRAINPDHSDFGKQFLEGDWEGTTSPIVLDSPPGSVCFSTGGFVLWICDGRVTGPGSRRTAILGFIPSFASGTFMAHRIDGVRAAVYGAGQQDQALAPNAASLWNGRCPACGLGTYTGLFQTQHEGGSCPKG